MLEAALHREKHEIASGGQKSTIICSSTQGGFKLPV